MNDQMTTAGRSGTAARASSDPMTTEENRDHNRSDQSHRGRRGHGFHRRRLVTQAAAALMETVVILPARNEEAGVLLALESLAAQTAPPDLIVIVVNNSSDRTEEFAREFADRPGVPRTVVFNLPDNPHKKAGALNHGIGWLNRTPGGLAAAARYLLVMDADTSLHPKFLERARNVMASDRRVGGLSATCLGRTGLWKNLWQRYLLGMQIMEYGRYARGRYRFGIHSMSGAGSFYRTEALLSILRWRGEVFWEDHANLVEDYETTLALKEAGWKVTANQHCIAYTDLMPTLRELIGQRERWGRGTVDTLRRRGWTKHTWFSITSMVLGFVGFLYTLAWLATWTGVIASNGFVLDRVWLCLVAFWIAYAAFRARHLGWKGVLVDVLMLPGLVFAGVRAYWFVTSVVKSYATGVSAWK